MSNELILIINLIAVYGGVLVWFRLFGTRGLMCWTVLATIAANIEVMMLVDAFGLQQTLGNVLFGSTFLVTDILSETAGKQKAKEAVNLGIATSFTFILLSQFWLLYTPNAEDWAAPHIQAIFSNTPRMMLAGLLVYAIVQRFDVWLYNQVWKYTTRTFGDKRKLLWVRNNASTLISQLLNAFLFTFGAFYGTYEVSTLLHIVFVSYLIFIVTSITDTPAVYWARRMKERGLIKMDD